MPELCNPSLGSGAVAMQNVALTPAQIQQLHTTPVTIIPAPGAGFVIVPIEAVLVNGTGSIAYTSTGLDSLSLTYTGASAQAFAAALSNFVVGNLNHITSKAGTAFNAVSLLAAGNINNQSVQIAGSFNYNAGTIVTATLGAGGTGYVVNDTGTITQGNNDATYIVTSIGANGAVTGFTITGAGTANTVANLVATVTGGAQPGVGANFTVNITAVTLGNGTLRVILYYTIVPVP
jgi:hypothetical protein